MQDVQITEDPWTMHCFDINRGCWSYDFLPHFLSLCIGLELFHVQIDKLTIVSALKNSLYLDFSYLSQS